MKLPKYLVIVAPEMDDLTPDDLTIVPVEKKKEVETLWDEHDGRSDGNMILAVYELDPDVEYPHYKRSLEFGILGVEGKTRPADSEKDMINHPEG